MYRSQQEKGHKGKRLNVAILMVLDFWAVNPQRFLKVLPFLPIGEHM